MVYPPWCLSKPFNLIYDYIYADVVLPDCLHRLSPRGKYDFPLLFISYPGIPLLAPFFCQKSDSLGTSYVHNINSTIYPRLTWRQRCSRQNDLDCWVAFPFDQLSYLIPMTHKPIVLRRLPMLTAVQHLQSVQRPSPLQPHTHGSNRRNRPACSSFRKPIQIVDSRFCEDHRMRIRKLFHKNGFH